MAATVSIRCNYSTDAGSQSSTISGFDLISADNCTNSTTNRQDNPITAGNRSYEKWLTAYVDAAPDNYIENLQLWGDASVSATTTLYVGVSTSGSTPTSGDSSVATNDWTSYTSGNKFTWHSSQMTGIGSTSDFAVFQLDTGASASAGNWTQETINYSYDEA